MCYTIFNIVFNEIDRRRYQSHLHTHTHPHVTHIHETKKKLVFILCLLFSTVSCYESNLNSWIKTKNFSKRQSFWMDLIPTHTHVFMIFPWLFSLVNLFYFTICTILRFFLFSFLFFLCPMLLLCWWNFFFRKSHQFNGISCTFNCFSWWNNAPRMPAALLVNGCMAMLSLYSRLWILVFLITSGN